MTAYLFNGFKVEVAVLVDVIWLIPEHLFGKALEDLRERVGHGVLLQVLARH